LAGVLGSLIVNFIADRQKAAGLSGPALYGLSFRIMIGLLIIGFICNELIKPVDAKFHRTQRRPRLGSKGGIASCRTPRPRALPGPAGTHRNRLAVGSGPVPLRSVAAADQGGAAVQRLSRLELFGRSG